VQCETSAFRFCNLTGEKPPTAEVRKNEMIGQKEVEHPEKTESDRETAMQPSVKNARPDQFGKQFCRSEFIPVLR